MPVFSVTTTSQRLYSAERNRKTVLLQNQSDQTLKIRLFRDAPGEGLDLAAGSPGGCIILKDEDASGDIWVSHEGTGDKNLYHTHQ